MCMCVCVCVCVCVFSSSIVSNSYNTMECSLPGSSVHVIIQARILDWLAVFFPGGLPKPGIKPTSPAATPLQSYSLPLKHQESLYIYIYTHTHIYI